MSWTTLTDKFRKIRKERRCFGCLRMFPVGSVMKYVSGIFDGDVCGTYHCPTCNKHLNYFRNTFENEIDEGWMRDEMNGSKETVEEFSFKRMTNQAAYEAGEKKGRESNG